MIRKTIETKVLEDGSKSIKTTTETTKDDGTVVRMIEETIEKPAAPVSCAEESLPSAPSYPSESSDEAIAIDKDIQKDSEENFEPQAQVYPVEDPPKFALALGDTIEAPDTAKKTVNVIAPATLLEGYTFKATVDGKVFIVTVPKGGVSQGQVFSVPYPRSGTNLTESATSASSKTSGPPLLNITAPETLPAGSAFKAKYNDKEFHVTVPEGGVVKGQTMCVPCPTSVATPPTTTKVVEARVHAKEFSVPVGAWRDGPFDCFNDIQPMFFWACCLAPMALAQILTRLKLNILGQPQQQPNDGLDTYTIMAIILFAIYFFLFIFLVIVAVVPTVGLALFWMFLFVWQVYLIAFGTMTRTYMREKFQIPGDCFADCCLTYWCGCCSLLQMHRHTHDHKVYRGDCCSHTGLAYDAPEIV